MGRARTYVTHWIDVWCQSFDFRTHNANDRASQYRNRLVLMSSRLRLLVSQRLECKASATVYEIHIWRAWRCDVAHGARLKSDLVMVRANQRYRA